MIPACILAIENDSDREYMTWLFVQYEKLMYATIYKILGSPWNTEDTLQSCIEKLIDKIETLKKFDEKQLANYIVVASRNTAYNVIRNSSRHEAWSFDELNGQNCNDEPYHVEEMIIHKEDLSMLAKVWEKLDEKSCYLLEAKYILEKSDEEISSDLKIKVGSVRMALTRAKRKAAKLMKEESLHHEHSS